MRSIWDRRLTTNRMVLNGAQVTVIREKDRLYLPTHASRMRPDSILPLAEPVGAALFEFPDNVCRDVHQAHLTQTVKQDIFKGEK
jgi:hypothetical protein